MNVLITGATKGIGRAVAERFAQESAALAVCARSEQDLEALKHDLTNDHGVDIITSSCDVSKKEQVKAFADQVRGKWDKLDVLVNNAGLFIPGKVSEEEDGALENMISTNLYSAYNLTRELLSLMVPHKTGHIFNMCSVASLKAYPNGGSYTISKFALWGFLLKSLREELKEHNISVTSFLPGAVYTPSWEGAGLPESRFAEAKDIAKLVFDIYSLSSRTVVEDIILRPMLGDI